MSGQGLQQLAAAVVHAKEVVDQTEHDIAEAEAEVRVANDKLNGSRAARQEAHGLLEEARNAFDRGLDQ